MKKNKTLLASSVFALAMLSGNAVGDAGISYTTAGKPDNVNAQVDFEIIVPQVLILRVGDWKDQVNSVVWNYAFGITGLADPTSDAAADQNHWSNTGAPSALAASSDDESESDAAGNGILKVAAFGNTGANLTLTSDSTAFSSTTATGAQPKLSEITAAHTGNITHPTLADTGAGSTETLTHTDGIVREEDTWAYTYTPTNTPVGGTYNASVIYTLATL